MKNKPSKITLSPHAKQRIEERNEAGRTYNTKNLMNSCCKWYVKDDFIPNSSLFKRSLYVCRKSNNMRYMTDGYLEVLYDKNAKVAITIMNVKEKFMPITQFIKPERLAQRVA